MAAEGTTEGTTEGTSDKRTVDIGTDDVLARVEDGVGVVVLNRPERRNALSPDMLDALVTAIARLEADDDVGALLVTGAGGAFCAGGDVKGFAARGGAGGGGLTFAEREERQRRWQWGITGRLHAMGKPTVAALPGAAAGAGLGIALACDLRVGSPKTTLVPSFAKVALSGDFGTAWLLSRLVGPSRARRLMFFSERLDGRSAHDLGLLDWLVEPEKVVDEAMALAVRLASGPRFALRGMKENLLDAEALDLDAAMRREIVRYLECGVTDDHKEAVQAFVEKREPRFGAARAARASGASGAAEAPAEAVPTPR